MAQYLDVNGAAVLATQIKAKADKSYVDAEVTKAAERVYTPKGSVDTYDDLPTDAELGDIYQIDAEYEDTENNVTYPAGTDFKKTESGWVAMANAFDLSDYAKKSDIAGLTEVEAIPVATIEALFTTSPESGD